MDVDARKLTRYRLSAPVVFSWREADHTHRGEGITRDMSCGGLFIWSEQCPPVGAELRCEVFLPKVKPHSVAAEVVSMGRITRAERPSGYHHREGFAVTVAWPMVLRTSTAETKPGKSTRGARTLSNPRRCR